MFIVRIQKLRKTQQRWVISRTVQITIDILLFSITSCILLIKKRGHTPYTALLENIMKRDAPQQHLHDNVNQVDSEIV